jgi:HAD superfamily hydrolase (TIGR01509 family)
VDWGLRRRFALIVKQEKRILKLKIPAGSFGAYLFDCDGTVVDSMPLHFLAWKQALGEWNCAFSEDTFYAWGGLPVAEVISRLNVEHGLKMPVAAVEVRKENLYYDNISRLQVVPEVVEHIEAMYGKIPFAVVSGSTRESVVKSLDAVGLLDKFDTLVCAGDYAKSKPDPEPFLLAAPRLGVAPAACLVFEDTDMGIQSATAAGMASVKVPSPMERAGEITAYP